MSFSVGIHPPKTPITAGSHGVAKATLPNICKMPGPPAPFVPTPLPNIGKSELSPKGYSKTVTIEGKAVAIRGASFNSIGDMASKGTGGGLLSANTHGPTKFISPGSPTVSIEGKAVHLLGEPMLNNCGPSGTPSNTGATLTGVKNPKSEKPKLPPPCPDGEHSEKIEYPTPFREERDAETRITRGREAAATAGDRFEMDAAAQNLRDKHIGKQGGRQIGRNALPRDGKAPGDSQKVHLVCTICGKKREIDHVSDDGTVVEAKSGNPNDPGQIANNRKFVQDGGKVTYKIPLRDVFDRTGGPSQRAQNLMNHGFGVAGV